MADIFSGYKRSLKCYVSKKLNGVEDVGYPKQYPTATDISNGYFTYNSIQYDVPTSAELSTMSQAAYDSLLATFKLYVESIEAGASFATDTIVAPTIYDPNGCAVDVPTTTTTSTTTTTELSPDMTYNITSDGSGYVSTQTIFTISGAQVGDIVIINVSFNGTLKLQAGYSSTMARLFVSYPGGTAHALSQCYSDTGAYEVSISKTISFIATGPSFNIATEMSKINSLNATGEFICSITNVSRGATSYLINKSSTGKYYKSMESQFSC